MRSNELVLVVDDAEDTRTVYAEALCERGYLVETARDGREAVAKARRLEPSVVVMDLAMPEVDGFQATSTLKSDPATNHIWVLAVTGHAERRFVDRAYASKVDGILIKPCSPVDVVARVDAFMERGRRRDA